jgi:photosystem II stability/assembly factor-like uncharacterized protein
MTDKIRQFRAHLPIAAVFALTAAIGAWSMGTIIAAQESVPVAEEESSPPMVVASAPVEASPSIADEIIPVPDARVPQVEIAQDHAFSLPSPSLPVGDLRFAAVTGIGMWAVAVGDDGVIAQTTDRGETWQAKTVAFGVGLSDVALPTSAVGYVVGQGGMALRTVDGGATWTVLPLPSDVSLTGVDFVNADSGWVVGDAGTAFRTSDGGSHWDLMDMGTMAAFTDVAVTNRRVVVTGNDGTVTVFSGGDVPSHWSSDAGATFVHVAMVEDAYGYALTDGGSVIATTDDGVTWSASTNERLIEMSGIAALNQGAVAVGASGTIARTADGGATWAVDASRAERGEGFVAVFLTKTGWGMAVSVYGAVVRTADGGQTWSPGPRIGR